MVEIFVVNENIRLQAELGSNLREIFIESKIPLYSNIFTRLFNCRGNGFCGTCKVDVESGVLDKPNQIELKKLKKDLHINKNIRLACQLSIKSDLKVRTI